MSAANRVTAEEVVKVLIAHKPGWLGTRDNGFQVHHYISTARCSCGWKFENGKLFNATGIHRLHVAAHILKLLERKGERP